MANYYEKIRIKTATEGKHKRTMRATTDTSTDFGQFLPLRVKMLELGQGTIKPYTFSNMMPLPQPTFGTVKYTNRIFSVPIHTFFKAYEDYRQDVIHVTADESSTSIGTLPYTNNDAIVDSIIDSAGPTTAGSEDFRVDDNGTVKYYYHTAKSAWWVKFLHTLGYRWVWRRGYSLDQGGVAKNMLRILATSKVYSDYYYNKAYRGDADDIALRQLFERDNGNLFYDKTDLGTIRDTIQWIYYDMDYFTSAWDNPDTPNINNQASTYTINDPNNPVGGSTWDNVITNAQGKDPTLTGQRQGVANYSIPTQVALNLLKSLTMFLKRNQLAGGDTMTRFLARYGVMNNDLQAKRSREIGSQTWIMQVHPIFSNSDTAAQGGEVLGSYAGQGYAESNTQSFRHETNCDCMIVEILEVRPIENYTDGEDRENLIMTKTDLITPEFDSVGTEAVIAAELVMPRTQGVLTDSNNIYSKVFGWLPRYAWMKTMKDIIAGNYSLEPYANTYLPYTMVRRISDNQAIANIVHSKGFTKMNDATQFDRIFYGQTTDKQPFDNINIHHELEIEWHSYAKPLYDNYDWEHEGGKEIEVQNQGNI